MNNKKINVIMVFVLVIILVTILLVINISKIDKNKTINRTTKIYTTTKEINDTKDYSTNSNVVEININGEKELISVKTYVSYLGYQIDYMSDYFNANTISNGIVVINSNEDDGTSLKIELLNEETYNDQYSTFKNEINNNYLTSYIFFRGNNKFLKVTKTYNINNTNLDKKLTYMINSIYLN